jgi:hypothetical protein
MAENYAKISLIFEIKQLNEEKDCWCYCKQCDKQNLKKAIVIKDFKVDSKGDWPYSARDRTEIAIGVFKIRHYRDVNNLFRLKYFCSKGCAKLFFEIKSGLTTGKWCNRFKY